MNSDNHGISSTSYITIQGWMCNEMGLKGNDLLVYALINGFSQDGKSKFYGGRQYIANTFNISLPTVDKALNNLVELNYIIKEPCKTQAETDIYYINISSKETLLGGSKETLSNNTSNKINNTFTNVKVAKAKTPTRRHLVTVDNMGTVSKPVSKKKSKYEQCIEDINNFTDNVSLRNVLVTYLKMRLEMKDSPIYHNQWVGMLNKLKELSDTVEGMLEIVQQSINRGYKGFFAVKQYNRSGGQDQRVFSEYGQVKSVKSDGVVMNVQF